MPTRLPDDKRPLLLLLNDATFRGDSATALARQVRAALHTRRPLLLVHQTSTPFETFFGVTPRDLLLLGIYRELAVPRIRPACRLNA